MSEQEQEDDHQRHVEETGSDNELLEEEFGRKTAAEMSGLQRYDNSMSFNHATEMDPAEVDALREAMAGMKQETTPTKAAPHALSKSVDPSYQAPQMPHPRPLDTALDALRTKVSKHRKRFVAEDGTSLDLTYITPRVIAMGFPSSGVEAVYRNPLENVVAMLNKQHAGKFGVVNLTHRQYDYSRFENRVTEFGFSDHHAPTLQLLCQACAHLADWLAKDPEHVAVVHCKAGKGRTGTVISAFLLWCQAMEDPTQALHYYARMRSNREESSGIVQFSKDGVTIPSQKRYVKYLDSLLRGFCPARGPVRLMRIVMTAIPNFDADGSCRPYFKIFTGPEHDQEVFSNKDMSTKIDHEMSMIVFTVDAVLPEGDLFIKFKHKGTVRTALDMFHLTFHSGFIDRDKNFLRFTKHELDGARHDKRVPKGLLLDLYFGPLEGPGGGAQPQGQECEWEWDSLLRKRQRQLASADSEYLSSHSVMHMPKLELFPVDEKDLLQESYEDLLSDSEPSSPPSSAKKKVRMRRRSLMRRDPTSSSSSSPQSTSSSASQPLGNGPDRTREQQHERAENLDQSKTGKHKRKKSLFGTLKGALSVTSSAVHSSSPLNPPDSSGDDGSTSIHLGMPSVEQQRKNHRGLTSWIADSITPVKGDGRTDLEQRNESKPKAISFRPSPSKARKSSQPPLDSEVELQQLRSLVNSLTEQLAMKDMRISELEKILQGYGWDETRYS
eukprot:g56318.t1